MGLFGGGGGFTGIGVVDSLIGGAGDLVGGYMNAGKANLNMDLVPEVKRKDFILPTGLAAAQTQRGFQQAQQAALGQIAASRGVNPALLMRQGQRASENLYNQAMQQGQIANLAEAQQAQQNLMKYNELNQAGGLGKLNAQAGVATANAANKQGQMNNLIGAAGNALMAFSDEKMKKNFKEDDSAIESVLEAFSKSKQWQYKDESNGEGKFMGPMAQDLEKAKPDMVSEANNGMKQVDMNKALMAIMAAQGHLYKKIKKMEKAA